MTKPAGVFLQLLSIPIMLAGCTAGLTSVGDSQTLGWLSFAFGVWLLWIGGLPARRS